LAQSKLFIPIQDQMSGPALKASPGQRERTGPKTGPKSLKRSHIGPTLGSCAHAQEQSRHISTYQGCNTKILNMSIRQAKWFWGPFCPSHHFLLDRSWFLTTWTSPPQEQR